MPNANLIKLSIFLSKKQKIKKIRKSKQNLSINYIISIFINHVNNLKL